MRVLPGCSWKNSFTVLSTFLHLIVIHAVFKSIQSSPFPKTLPARQIPDYWKLYLSSKAWPLMCPHTSQYCQVTDRCIDTTFTIKYFVTKLTFFSLRQMSFINNSNISKTKHMYWFNTKIVIYSQRQASKCQL